MKTKIKGRKTKIYLAHRIPGRVKSPGENSVSQWEDYDEGFENIIVLSSGLAMLTACSAIDIDKTRMMASKGTPFQKALHKEYAELAFLEDDEGDSEDAIYFNNKAMMSAAGNKVDPQKIKECKLPGDSKWELDAARRALIAELLSGGKEKMPAKAARAQAMFDYWMQEKEENDQPKDIARCRSAFDQALKDLGNAPMTRVMAAAPAPAGLPPVPDLSLYSSRLTVPPWTPRPRSQSRKPAKWRKPPR